MFEKLLKQNTNTSETKPLKEHMVYTKQTLSCCFWRRLFGRHDFHMHGFGATRWIRSDDGFVCGVANNEKAAIDSQTLHVGKHLDHGDCI